MIQISVFVFKALCGTSAKIMAWTGELRQLGRLMGSFIIQGTKDRGLRATETTHVRSEKKKLGSHNASTIYLHSIQNITRDQYNAGIHPCYILPQ